MEEAPEEVQEAATTAVRKALMKMKTPVGAILPVRGEEPVVCLETGTGEPVPEHQEACRAATMEGKQEDRLELVEAAPDGEEVPLEVTYTSVEV